MRFLIVDDEPINIRLLEGLLKKHGQCETATNGNMAFESFKHSLDSAQPYDAIFLDIMMPLCSGHEALSKIREEEDRRGITSENYCKVFMVTALNDAENQFEALANGVVGYLVKPIDRKTIEAGLGKAGLI